jgi:bifunctional non-homologous end joining protein LigD
MLASPMSSGALDGPGWRFEMKWDGVRAVCDVRGERARLWSRNGKDITGAFPDLAGELPSALRGTDAILDGEIIAMDAGGRPSFERLQDRLGVAGAREVASRVSRTPAHLMLFDVLEIRGERVVDRPYLERRELLETLVTETPRVHVPPSYTTDLENALAISREHGLEGVVAKRPESPYLSGARTPSWRKVKHEQSQEVLVAGWVDGAAGGLGSLVVAVPEAGGGLRYAGRVGTGFSDQERAALEHALHPLSRPAAALTDAPREAGSPIHWVTPTLVGEVRFAEWTKAGRMRHPSWRGLRHDKDPADVQPPDAA